MFGVTNRVKVTIVGAGVAAVANGCQTLGSRDRGAYSRSPDGDSSQRRDSFRGQGHEQGVGGGQWNLWKQTSFRS